MSKVRSSTFQFYALCSSALVAIKPIKLLQASLLLYSLLLDGTSTYKIKALHLVSNVPLVKHFYSNYSITLLLFGRVHDMLHYKATPISYIDSKYQIKKLKGSRIC